MSYIMLGIIFKSYSSRGFTLRSQGSKRRKEDKSTTHLFQIYDALITPYASHYEYIA